MVEFDPYSYAVHEDPYPFYKALRDEAPAYWNDRVKFWALSRHADVLAAFKDSARYSNAGGVSLERSSAQDPSAVAFFLAMDPPRHDQLRNLVSRAFTPRRVTELEPRVRAITAHYIDRFVEAIRRSHFPNPPASPDTRAEALEELRAILDASNIRSPTRRLFQSTSA